MRRLIFVTAVFLAAWAPASTSPIHAGTDWAGFRGPNSNGAVQGDALFEGGAKGLALGWKRPLGSGYSAVVVAEGRVVAMFAAGEDDVVAAFDPASGKEMWRYRIGKTYVGHDGSHDGPISTPLVADGRVFGLGPWGQLFAVDAATGAEVWTKQLVEDLGAKSPYYGFTSSPLHLDGVLVVEIGAPEGQAIAGFDPATGEVKWAVGQDGVNYQSPIAGSIGGRRQVIAVGDAKLFGIDPASGEMLWSHEHGGDARAMGGKTIVPLPAGEGRFFLMNKQDSSTMYEISRDANDAYTVSELWTNNAIRGSYVPPVFHEGYIYGISGRVLTCVDAVSGETEWRSREPGDGLLTMAGDKLVVMTKQGSLHIAEASPEGYRELASFDLFSERAWSEVAIAGGHLFARSMDQLARIDVVATGDAERGKSWIADTEFGQFLSELEAATDKDAAIATFMARQTGFPIIEGSDVVHFVFDGSATDVGIVGDQVGFRREDPMTRVPGTDLFYYSTRLEPEAAVTYGFIPDYGEPIADPLNPHPAKGLFGEVSWLAMPAWQEGRFLAEATPSNQGRLETVEWERDVTKEVDGAEQITKESRTVQVYLPAGFDPAADRRYPTIYHHSGKGALEEGSTKNALDNLIGESVEPLIAVFIMPREGAEDDEPGPLEPHLKMVVEEIVPLIDERYPTLREPGARASVGTADAGAAAVMAGIMYPDVFGRVGGQSAVFFSMPIAKILDEAGRPPMTMYLDWGTYDLRSPHEAWDMAQDNRDAWAAFRSRGYRPAGGELPEGYGWKCWSGHTDELLRALFPLKQTR